MLRHQAEPLLGVHQLEGFCVGSRGQPLCAGPSLPGSLIILLITALSPPSTGLKLRCARRQVAYGLTEKAATSSSRSMLPLGCSAAWSPHTLQSCFFVGGRMHVTFVGNAFSLFVPKLP